MLTPAELCWDDGVPRSARFNDIYHSADGAREVQRVFIRPGNLQARFADPTPSTFTIGELGFGTGLNFAAVVQLFLESARPGVRLHFISVEKHPISPAQFDDIADRRRRELPVYKLLRRVYPPLLNGWHRRHFYGGRVTLSVYHGDAAEGLRPLPERMARSVDHWLLDGFAPDRNPEMWSRPLLESVAALSTRTTTLCTFSAAGRVRRTLSALGFAVQRIDQLPHKRHSTLALFSGQRAPFSAPRRVTVIGAGIAGACTARSLAERSIPVRLVDLVGRPAIQLAGAIVNPRLLPGDSPAAAERVRGYLFSSHWLARFTAMSPSGVLQLPGGGLPAHRLEAVAETYADTGNWLRRVDPGSASSISEVPVRSAGLLLRDAGSVDLAALTMQLCEHPDIDYVSEVSQSAATAHHDDAPRVLCTGPASGQLELTGYLELLPVWGQMEHIQVPVGPRLPLVGQGLLSPCADGYWVGSSYEHSAWTPERASRFNLARFETWWRDSLGVPLNYRPVGQVRGVRAVTSDRLPIVGPVHDRDQRPVAGWYLNTGHGSHGTVTAPFAADCIAASLNGEFPAQSVAADRAVSGLRFLERQARRGPRHGARDRT